MNRQDVSSKNRKKYYLLICRSYKYPCYNEDDQKTVKYVKGSKEVSQLLFIIN